MKDLEEVLGLVIDASDGDTYVRGFKSGFDTRENSYELDIQKGLTRISIYVHEPKDQHEEEE